jgi:hypothetical protein
LAVRDRQGLAVDTGAHPCAGEGHDVPVVEVHLFRDCDPVPPHLARLRGNRSGYGRLDKFTYDQAGELVRRELGPGDADRVMSRIACRRRTLMRWMYDMNAEDMQNRFDRVYAVPELSSKDGTATEQE